jgi:pilus assembly protein Flp/PilA
MSNAKFLDVQGQRNRLKRIFVSFNKGQNSMKYIKRFLTEDSGQDMVEYGLLAAFVSIVAIGALRAIGPLVNTIYTGVQTALTP